MRGISIVPEILNEPAHHLYNMFDDSGLWIVDSIGVGIWGLDRLVNLLRLSALVREREMVWGQRLAAQVETWSPVALSEAF
jgi:hypothetical protein